MRKSFAVAALLVLVFGAGCGGSKSASGGASGATIAPASSLAFVSVNTDESSDQWKSADALLKKFPIRDRLLAVINAALSDQGVDFNRDIRPLLGPELDFVVLSAGSSSPQLVGLTQPTDAQKFDSFLEKGSTPSVHTEIDGWTVFSDRESTLDQFKTEAAKGKLADDSSFKDSTADLPGQSNAIAYVNGAQALGLLQQSVPQLGALPAGQLRWGSASLTSESDSLKLDGSFASAQGVGGNFKATLLSRVPSGSLVVLSFHGSAELTRQLTQNPAIAQAGGQLQQTLGLSVADIVGLIQGEGVLYVRAGSPFPEVTLILQEPNPARAVSLLDRLASRLAPVVGATWKGHALSFGPVSVRWGAVGGALVISDSSAPFGAGSSSSIIDDPVFSKAKEAAGLPDESAGFFYVNIKDSIPVIEGFAQSAGSSLPPDVSQNLAPLESVLLYATSDGDVTKFSALLQTR